MRFKEDSIPSIYGEYEKRRKLDGNYQEEKYRIPQEKKGTGKKAWEKGGDSRIKKPAARTGWGSIGFFQA